MHGETQEVEIWYIADVLRLAILNRFLGDNVRFVSTAMKSGKVLAKILIVAFIGKYLQIMINFKFD